MMNDDLDKALVSHQKSLEIWEREKFVLGISLAHVYIGQVYADKGEREMARFYLYKAIDIGRENDLRNTQVYAMKGLADIFALDANRFGEYEALADEMGRPDLNMMVQRQMADYAVRDGNFDEARIKIQKAEKLVTDRSIINIALELAMLDLTRAKLAFKDGEVEKARDLALNAEKALIKTGRKLEARKAKELASEFVQ